MWAYLVGLGVVALILVTSHLPRSGHNPASSFVDGDGQESGGMWRRHLLDQEEDADPFAAPTALRRPLRNSRGPSSRNTFESRAASSSTCSSPPTCSSASRSSATTTLSPHWSAWSSRCKCRRTWPVPLLWPPVRRHPNWPPPSLAALSPRVVLFFFFFYLFSQIKSFY